MGLLYNTLLRFLDDHLSANSRAGPGTFRLNSSRICLFPAVGSVQTLRSTPLPPSRSTFGQHPSPTSRRGAIECDLRLFITS